MMTEKKPIDVHWGNIFRKRKPADVSRNQFLRTIPFFECLTDKQLKNLALHLHERRYEENEYLFEVNHPAAALFIIGRGEIIVENTSAKDGSVELATLKSGEFLGELALLDSSPRSASARAIKPTETFALFRGDLLRLEKEDPEMTSKIYRTLAWVIGERLKATNRQVGNAKKAA
jgi:CRP/FNR family transcriptional regulator, cyclic AMP receptor protein